MSVLQACLTDFSKFTVIKKIILISFPMVVTIYIYIYEIAMKFQCLFQLGTIKISHAKMHVSVMIPFQFFFL